MDRSCLYDVHDVYPYMSNNYSQERVFGVSIRSTAVSLSCCCFSRQKNIICLQLRGFLSKREVGNRYGPSGNYFDACL
jgi:hypothetical protein